MPDIYALIAYLTVGALWGVTNVLMRQKDPAKSGVRSLLQLRTLVPFMLNQGGSLLFYFLLGSQGTLDGSVVRCFEVILAHAKRAFSSRHLVPMLTAYAHASRLHFLVRADISVAVLACNALALVCTTVTAAAMGETLAKPLETAVGLSLVLAGVALCVCSNVG